MGSPAKRCRSPSSRVASGARLSVPRQAVDALEDRVADHLVQKLVEHDLLDGAAGRRRGRAREDQRRIAARLSPGQRAADLRRRAGMERCDLCAAQPLARAEGFATCRRDREGVCLVPQPGDADAH